MITKKEGDMIITPFLVQEDDSFQELLPELYEAMINTVGVFYDNYNYRFIMNDTIPFEQYMAQREAILSLKDKLDGDLQKYGWSTIRHVLRDLFDDSSIYYYSGDPYALIISRAPMRSIKVYTEVSGAYGRRYYIDQNGKRHNADHSLYGEIPYDEKGKESIDILLEEIEGLRHDYLYVDKPDNGLIKFDAHSKSDFSDRFGGRCNVVNIVNHKGYDEMVEIGDVEIKHHTIVSVSRDRYMDSNGVIHRDLYVIPEKFDESMVKDAEVRKINHAIKTRASHDSAERRLKSEIMRVRNGLRNKSYPGHISGDYIKMFDKERI